MGGFVSEESHTGGCLCTAVRYRVEGPLRSVVACHCRQCRKTSGHHVAATNAAARDTAIQSSDDALVWFRSSEAAERGFCGRCGSNLFWRMIDGDRIAIMAGSLDEPTGLTLDRHIYCAFKGDYYAIPEGHETFPESD